MQVWGTFAVNDHLPKGAFVREVLLFDRLVIPVPSSDTERDRWCRPDASRPAVSWRPERLEELLGILGTKSAPGWNGARLAVPTLWDPDRWQAGLARPEIARMIHSESVWQMTRTIVANDQAFPGIVDAVAAYPSANACRSDLGPAAEPAGLTDAEALVMIARPMLVPDLGERDELDALREAIELASELKYQRAAYHQWVREQVGAARKGRQVLDPESIEMMREELRELLEHERVAVRRLARGRRWTRIEWATTVIGAGLGFAALLATAPPLAPVALTAPVFQFGGWVASKRADIDDGGAVLSGASLFISAEQTPGWATLPS